MSRRKQSIPCKVQGSSSPPTRAKTDTSFEIVKLHELTDSLLDRNNTEHDALATDSYLSNEKNNMDKDDGVGMINNLTGLQPLHDHDNAVSRDSDGATDLRLSPPLSLGETQSRSSVRLRDRFNIHPEKEDENSSCGKKRKFDEYDVSNTTPRKVLFLSDNAEPDGTPRKRTTSHDEELTCPICHKSFMSKYGLLTHSEVHSTPELKCAPCNMSFSSRTVFVAHQLSTHHRKKDLDSCSPMKSNLETISKKAISMAKEYSVISGFSDLSFVDFTCGKFTLISEDMCSKALHRLSERDRQHFFLCKLCNLLYPTLFALQFHMKTTHLSVSSDGGDILPLPKRTSNVTDVDVESAFKETDLSEDEPVDKLDDDDALQNILGLVGLAPKQSNDNEGSKNPDKGCSIRYGMDNSQVQTSPMVAYVNIPNWMREDENAKDLFDLFNVNTDKESLDDHPPLKMKLVRRRGEEEKDGIHVAVGDYFVRDDPDILKSKQELMDKWDSKPRDTETISKSGSGFTCKVCGDTFASETALGGHRAGSMCGIGVRTSANGRRMFWCRLCNYASFEKSTILRHQRTHTGVRPYSCKFCSIAFTTKANCERHIRKRHRVRVSTDTDVKNAVYCDYDLLRKARDGEINLSAAAKGHGSRYNSSRNAITRHVTSNHGVTDRKEANDSVSMFRAQGRKPSETENRNEQLHLKGNTHLYSYVGNSHSRRAPVNSRENSSTNNSGHRHKAASSRAAKAPKLIPLFKIRAYHDASQKMLNIFQRNYNELVTSSSNRQDPEQLLSKIVSLLGSTSSMMKQNSPCESHSVFSPLDSLSSPSVFRSMSGSNNDEASETVGRKNSFVSLNKSEEDVNYDEDNFHDVAQLFADGDYSANSDEATNSDIQLQGSPGDESPFKPWKNSSSLMLRDFAANGSSRTSSEMAKRNKTSARSSGGKLSNISDLVSLVRKPSLMPIRGKTKGYERKSNFHHSRNGPSSGNGLRGKYRMILAKPKADQSSRDRDKLALTWRFIPEPPRTRDERGRYVRNPNAPHHHSSSKPMSLSAFRGSDDRPTMVSTKGGKFHLNVNRRRSLALAHRNHSLKGRKCPKCDKIFPWASSLSRHIMTHTGYKPYMCAGCSMRFTTRSNLLRHAYRRHGLERGSEDRHSMLVTLSLREQKEYAEKEAQKLVEMDEESVQAALDMEEQNEFEDDDADTSHVTSVRPEVEVSTSVPKDVTHFNKRYICGLCKLPFANRSNVVRHLHRLHDITKDHPNFRSLLVKIRNRVLASPRPLPPLDVNEDVATPPDDNQQLVAYSPPPTMVNGFDPPRPQETFIPVSSSPTAGVSVKIKPFTCGICSIGFTKRNNCARHITHQHNVDRKSERMRRLIIRNDMTQTQNDIGGKRNEPVSTETAEVNPTLSPPPLDPDLPELPSSPDVHQVDSGEAAHDAADEEDGNPPIDLSCVKKEPEELISQEEEQEEDKLSSTKEDREDSSSFSFGKRRRSSSRRKIEGEASMAAAEEEEAKPRKKNIRFTHFGCGVCKRIFKDVKELKEHLDEHNIPHPWHCTICGVPFTNKYNCQRHLLRRHGPDSGEPKYVEDIRHGPRSPRKRSRTYGR